MTEEQARLLFLDHCQPGNRGTLERHGERPAVAAILAALTPPAEPVSRPAGEREREAVARLIRERVGQDFDGECHLTEGEAYRILSLLSPAAPDAGGGWMPIETAPKDGTEILLYSVPNEVPSLKPHIGSGSWRSSSSFMAPGLWVGTHPIGPSFCPTHWMPLPAPPALQPGGER